MIHVFLFNSSCENLFFRTSLKLVYLIETVVVKIKCITPNVKANKFYEGLPWKNPRITRINTNCIICKLQIINMLVSC